jgi:hypothetical protein
MTKKTETFIDLIKVPDERIKMADSFMISSLLRDTLQLVEFLARARKMPAQGTENQLGFYTGGMYDTFLKEHAATMKRHVQRQMPAVVNSGKICTLRWSFEAPTAVKKLFADAGTHVSWFTIESHVQIKSTGKVKPMVTYDGLSTLIYNEPLKMMRVVEYISKLNATGGLPERVSKLEEIVEGLSKSVIYATNKPEDRAGATRIPDWFRNRAPSDLDHQETYNFLHTKLSSDQKVYEHITGPDFSWFNIRAELAVLKEIHDKGNESVATEKLAVATVSTADEIYDQLKHWEMWQEAAEVVLKHADAMLAPRKR